MNKIKKAIIPVAGLSTRVYPMNKVMPKSILPIYDDIDKRMKPAILKLCEELTEAGIETIYLITRKEDKHLYQEIFQNVPKNVLRKLNQSNREYDNKLYEIGKKIKCIEQEEPLGFGHAVYCAYDYVKEDKACLLLLGDTIYKSYEQKSCVKQLLDYYNSNNKIIIALQEIEKSKLCYYGISRGDWKDKYKKEMSIKEIVEKPSIEYANKNLKMDEKFWGNFGEFILTQSFFKELKKLCDKDLNDGEEYQLMDVMEKIVKDEEVNGFIINGKSYDLGNIDGYINAMKELL